MPLDIGSVFAVPIAQGMHPDPVALNADLRALLLQRESAGARFANRAPSLRQQPGVFESEFTMFSWPEPCVQALREFCWASLGTVVAQSNGYSAAEMARLRIFSHTWFHVTRRGGFVLSHAHPMASWSGVYCVDPGDLAPEFPDSGVLRFLNPHAYSDTFVDAGNVRMQAPFHHGTWNIRFQPGQIVIFPSWLQHEVLPFFGAGERITVAFNCWFDMAPPGPTAS